MQQSMVLQLRNSGPGGRLHTNREKLTFSECITSDVLRTSVKLTHGVATANYGGVVCIPVHGWLGKGVHFVEHKRKLRLHTSARTRVFHKQQTRAGQSGLALCSVTNITQFILRTEALS